MKLGEIINGGLTECLIIPSPPMGERVRVRGNSISLPPLIIDNL